METTAFYLNTLHWKQIEILEPGSKAAIFYQVEIGDSSFHRFSPFIKTFKTKLAKRVFTFTKFELPPKSYFEELGRVVMVTKVFTFISQKGALIFIVLSLTIKSLTRCIYTFDLRFYYSNEVVFTVFLLLITFHFLGLYI